MSLSEYTDKVSAMWSAMRTLQPAEFGRFTGLAAREISVCVDEAGISPGSNRVELELLLPLPFVAAMAAAPDSRLAKMPLPPEPFAGFLRDGAAACQRLAASSNSGASLPLALGEQAARAVLEGVDDPAYLTWAIYRAYLEVLLEVDPLPGDTERASLELFQSGLRTAWRT